MIDDNVGAGGDIEFAVDIDRAKEDVAVDAAVDDEVVDAVAVEVAGGARVGKSFVGGGALDFEGVGEVGGGAAGGEIESGGVGRRGPAAGVGQGILEILRREVVTPAPEPVRAGCRAWPR